MKSRTTTAPKQALSSKASTRARSSEIEKYSVILDRYILWNALLGMVERASSIEEVMKHARCRLGRMSSKSFRDRGG